MLPIPKTIDDLVYADRAAGILQSYWVFTGTDDQTYVIFESGELQNDAGEIIGEPGQTQELLDQVIKLYQQEQKSSLESLGEAQETFFRISVPEGNDAREWAKRYWDTYGFDYDPSLSTGALLAWPYEGTAQELAARLSEDNIHFETFEADPASVFDIGETMNELPEKKLTTAARKALSKSSFVFPKDRRYPIPDKAHARNALARVSQHGSPAEKSKVRAAVKCKFPGIGQHEHLEEEWEATMGQLRKLDPWTMGAVRRYAAARMKQQDPEIEEIGSSDINHWLYDFLTSQGFDMLMNQVRRHTGGAFESFDPEAPLKTFEFMGHKIDIYHMGESTGELNEFIAYIDGEPDEMTIADTAQQAEGNAMSVCHMLGNRGPSSVVASCEITKQAEALVGEVLKNARAKSK